MNLLAIDPSSKMGWAHFKGENLHDFGIIHSDVDGDRWARLVDTFNQLEEAVNIFDIDMIVVEDVLPLVRHMMSTDALFWTVATFLNAGVLATDAGLDLVMAPVSSVKKNIAPDWRGDARSNKKAPIVDAVNKRFNLSLKLKHHNEADAIAIGCWAVDNVTKCNNILHFPTKSQ